MTALTKLIEKNHKLIILILVIVIAVMATSCIFHDLIPICHSVFGCDHKMHVISSF